MVSAIRLYMEIRCSVLNFLLNSPDESHGILRTNVIHVPQMLKIIEDFNVTFIVIRIIIFDFKFLMDYADKSHETWIAFVIQVSYDLSALFMRNLILNIVFLQCNLIKIIYRWLLFQYNFVNSPCFLQIIHKDGRTLREKCLTFVTGHCHWLL